ncbi:asparagine synthase (glutamine-hydrolyzing) [Pedobacter sp. P351]|uniref:asparagine synthase (glutamine-hydrolyzing) n=1 Tax=Pedobacter superstes TaxID=3133441 RepID=UPI0030B635E4
MCGIYGSTINYSEDILKEKLARINFRGPDYTEIRRTEDIILGHNRLAIIDLDARSNQPFRYLHLTIVFNGEIYNYSEIKAKLLKKGYQFTTVSDTEVICAAYLEYGQNCVPHFNGMFAFAIYDEKKRIVFGARDRFGKKPFYYCHSPHELEFASQPSQISLGRQLSVDQKAINQYYTWGYIPEPNCIWKEIKKLPAGHSFIYDFYSGEFEVNKYWDLDHTGGNEFSGSYQDAKHMLNELLTDSVKIRMNADVPLGVFLSGGIDSSLVVALAVQKVNNVKTFSIKFNEKGFDESLYAQRVANYLGTEHHTIECSLYEGIEIIKNFTRYFDEPFADSSAIPTLLLSKYTSKQVTVALSGDAGDEVFLGYSRYKWMKTINSLFALPLSIRQLLASFVKLSLNYRHKLIAKGIAQEDINTLYVNILGEMESSWIHNPNPGLKNELFKIISATDKPLLKRLSDFDIKTYLNEDINTKVDRASMAFSLESRSPLMDYRVIEFGRSLPVSFKYRMGNQKLILKDLLFHHVPSSLFNRPKAGFSMPLKEWFKRELKEYVLDNLSKDELKNIPGINVQRTEQIIQEHMTGKWNRSQQIWKLLVMSQWLKSEQASFVSNKAMPHAGIIA